MPGAGTGTRHLKTGTKSAGCRVPVMVPGAGAGAGQSQPAPKVPGAGAGLRCRVPVRHPAPQKPAPKVPGAGCRFVVIGATAGSRFLKFLL